MTVQIIREEAHMGNNLFRYATKELSQDAFLCWAVQTIHDDDLLRPIGVAMLNKMVGEERRWEDYRHVRVFRQFRKIDVLITLELDSHQHVIIVEDKTDSTEHSEQIKRYMERLFPLEPDDRKELATAATNFNARFASYQDGDEESELKIDPEANKHVCYVKTGYWEDIEKALEKNHRDNRKQGWHFSFLNAIHIEAILRPYLLESEIARMFHGYIASILKYRQSTEETVRKSTYMEKGKKNVFMTDYGQLCLLDSIFERRECKRIDPMPQGGVDKKTGERRTIVAYYDYIYTGNGFGIPWRQYCFWGEKLPDEPVGKGPLAHYLFWRVDPDRISLRYYLQYDSEGESPSEKALATKKRCFDIRDKIPKLSDKQYDYPNRSAKSEFSLIEMKFASFNNFDLVKENVLHVHEQFVKRFKEGRESPADMIGGS